MKEKEDKNDTDKMEEKLNQLRRDRVEDLAVAASLLGSWMHDRKYTIAEQLAITELVRSSVLVSYIQMQQMEGMEKFISEHPDAHIVVVDGQKPPASSKLASSKPRTFDPSSN